MRTEDDPSCTLNPGCPSSPPAEQARDRARIGDYEILGEIARGGMGIVYRARQPRLNRTVALKVMLPGIFANRAQVQRFNAEAQIAAALNHPNIISVYEIGEDAGTCFFSMALVQGVDLAHKGRVTADAAARYLEKLAQAVYYAHQRGVLHRDLKPSNILLDEHDEPRIVDFGIAKLTEDTAVLTQTGESLGTPSYMAPEQVHPEGTSISVATDIYALGGILYFLLTGRAPFAGGSRDQILWAVFYDEPEKPSQLNPDVPRDLETICLKCLSKSPEQRYATAGELAEDLRRYRNNEPINARPISRAQRVLLWARRNPALAFSICAIIAALSYGVIAQQFALQQARKARADAETLIEFMDKELTEKLRPLGRLDLTGDVIRKAEAYFRDQDEAKSGPAFLIRKASFFWRAGTLERDLGKIPEAQQMAINGLATLDRFESQRGSDAEALGLRANLELLLFRVAKSYGHATEARDHGQQAVHHERRALDMNPNLVEGAKLSEILLEMERYYRELGDPGIADTFLEEAVDRLTTLAGRDPGNLPIARLLAITHYHKGLAVEDHDKTSALAEFKAFTAGLEKIAQSAAEDHDWQFELTIAYARAATAHYALHDYDVSEALIEKWRTAAERLAAFDPNNVHWRESLAQSLAWSGLVTRDRRGETNPQVGEFFGKALETYRQLTDQNPIADASYDSMDQVIANLVRFYQATNHFAKAEKLLRDTVAQHWQAAARFPLRFQQQNRLAQACDNLSEFLAAEARPEEAAALCDDWVRLCKNESSRAVSGSVWAFAEARVHGLAGNLATTAVRYDLSVSHWRDSLALMQTLTNPAIATQIVEPLAYAFKSLLSVQEKRRDLPALIKAAAEGFNWLENSTPKTPKVVADFCQFVPDKALLLDPTTQEIGPLLDRCRKHLLLNPSELDTFDKKITNAHREALEKQLPKSASAPPRRTND
jgi:tetratricopeptide (TPR) repeat protein/predicted Ser/Thr protein kinase